MGCRERSRVLLRPVYAFLGHPALYPLGSLSYTGYLMQGFALEPVVAWDTAPSHGKPPFYTASHFMRMLVMIALCCAIALVLSLAVERPFMKVGGPPAAGCATESSTEHHTRD